MRDWKNYRAGALACLAQLPNDPVGLSDKKAWAFREGWQDMQRRILLNACITDFNSGAVTTGATLTEVYAYCNVRADRSKPQGKETT